MSSESVFHQDQRTSSVNSFHNLMVQFTLALLIQIVMNKKYWLLTTTVLISISSFAQHPLKHWMDATEIRYNSKQPVINYILTVDSKDTSSFEIEMRIRNVPDTFRVAMVAHPEYDDRYWRFVENFYLEAKNGRGSIQREDSALWKITTNGGEAVLHYRIHLPVLQDAFRSSWKAFLTPTGGLVGGPHSFMYVIGATLAPSYVTLNIPNEWGVVTGLEATIDPKTFFAPSVGILVDDPIFIGKYKSWSFNVNAVPHRVVYWPLPGAKVFDTLKLVSGIQKIVEQTSALFGRLPYRDYSFMLQDGALGSLEHNNSVTVGVPASQLADDVWSILPEIAHEYFHTWNLMRIHPVEYGDVSYKTPPLSKGLWFSEGLTIFYADLLMRRAGLPTYDSTRILHLQNLIRRYSTNPAFLKYSAEKISLASYGPVGMLGDYSASTHLQGEVLGSMLDLIIRNASNGTKSMDNAIRLMMENFSGAEGFTSKDIEQTIHDLCGCNVHQFFQDHVFGSKQIDFNKYLELIGLKATSEWKEVLSADGQPSPDLRVYSWQNPNENFIRLGITNPASCWAKAGLHTGDIIKSVNGTIIKAARDFRQLIREAKIGDKVLVEVEQPAGKLKANVLITGYQQPEVHIVPIAGATEIQKNLFRQWINNGTH
jgi:predicted metalloprotease with PDZ domain